MTLIPGIVDYILIINGHAHTGIDIPTDQCNVHTVSRDNVGFDMCGYRSVLDSGKVDLTQYHYFIFLNDGMLGPFLPLYYRGPW